LNLLKPEALEPMLKISRSAVYNLAHRGQLPGAKIGGTLRFRRRALYAFILAKERVAQGDAA
jgi:excisionase family DNA binding protein